MSINNDLIRHFSPREPIHIELPNKTVDVSMPEVFRQDDFLELIDILNGEFLPTC